MKTHDELMTSLMRTIAAQIDDGDLLVPLDPEDITVQRLRDGELPGCGLYRWMMTEIDEGSEGLYTEGNEAGFLAEAKRLINAALYDLEGMQQAVISLHDEHREQPRFDPVTLPNGMVVSGYVYRIRDDYPTPEDWEDAGIDQTPPDDAWEWQIVLRTLSGEMVDRHDSLENLTSTGCQWLLREVAESALDSALDCCREGGVRDYFDLPKGARTNDHAG